MKKNIKKRELVQRYLNKELSEEEIKQFEQEIKDNPELYEELLFQKEVEQSIKELIEENLFIKNLEIAHREYLENLKKEKKVSIFNRYYSLLPKENRQKPFWYAAAAIAVIVFGVALYLVYQNNMTNPETLYQTYKTEYSIPYLQRSTNDNANNDLSNALQLFSEKQYMEAVIEFDKLIGQNKYIPAAYYFKGLALLELGHTNNAIEFLKKVSSFKESEFVVEAEWNLALAYLKNNDIKNAEIQLEKVKNNYPFYAEKSKEILDKIK